MVFQNFALFFYLTVYENIAYGLKLCNLTKEDIDFAEGKEIFLAIKPEAVCLLLLILTRPES